MKLLGHILKIIPYLSHLLFFGVIFYILRPIFEWYLSKVPILGVDFYNSATYVSYLSRNFSFQFNGFKDIWFGGYPLSRDFISLSYYPMIFFAKFFELIRGIQIYVLVSLFLLAVFSYLLYFQISKSRVFSLLVTFFVIYSANIYGAAIWGGSLPYFTSQYFLPLTLLLVLKFIQTSNTKWLLVSMIAAGMGFLGHPLLMFGFTMPSAFVLIFFGVRTKHERFLGNVFERLGKVLIFGLGTIVVALPITFDQVWHMLLGILTSGPKSLLGIVKTSSSTPLVGEAATSIGANQVASFYKGLAKFVYTDTNIWLFWLAAAGAILFAFTFVFLRKRQVIMRVLPFAVITSYLGLHPVLNAYGFSLIPQGWYRAFWPFPVVLGALVASLWGEFFYIIRDKFKVAKGVWNFLVSNLPFAFLSVIFTGIGVLYFVSNGGEFTNVLDTKAEVSSAHPQALSINTSNSDLDNLKKQLVPSFLDGSDRNKRFYDADALVNVWWNSLYQMPLVRGYVDPPIATSERGGFFWLDIAIGNDSLVRDFKIPEQIAFNNALFLIDWYGIYYYEGGRVAISTSAPPSSYLLKNNVFDREEQTTVYGAIIKWQTQSGKPELHNEVPQYLKFYRVKDDLTSPILSATNAPAIAVFSNLSGYEDLMRALGFSNINSQRLVPVNAGPFIDDFKKDDFGNFDAVILNNYSYHNKNKAFALLLDYVKGGGKVFIDSGNESKESGTKNLPDIFPISSFVREELGKDWNLEKVDDSITKDVDLSKFGPLVFNDGEWKLATPAGEVRSGAKVILRHNGKPVIVKMQIGKGEMIWSGMNLLYHLNQYKSEDEYKLFNNILNDIVKLNGSLVRGGEAEWQKPEKVSIVSQTGARGVLFKEEGYSGWSAKLASSSNKNLKVYRTGPTFPGFMYVAVNSNKPFKVDFKYSGNFGSYARYVISLIFIIYILDKIFLDGFLVTRKFNFFRNTTRERLKKWWQKEE